ncbi:hypothetical protein T484DRAFT_1848668 [Baffinella frigidus]|nr:hypothetical protein T484DRAFT_1848668 [Cryptophyta sp. CCMP2293]
MDEARGKASGDGARARLALSRALWLNAAQSGGGVNKRSKAAEDGYREALEVSQQALDGFKEAGLKRTHVDVAFALVNQLYMKRRLGIADAPLAACCRHAVDGFARTLASGEVITYAVDGFARTADSSEVITSSETSGDGVASGDTSGEAPSGEEGGDEAETLAALRLAHGAALAATESDAGERAGMPAVVPILRRGLGLEDVLASAKKVAQKAAQAKKAPTSK